MDNYQQLAAAYVQLSKDVAVAHALSTNVYWALGAITVIFSTIVGLFATIQIINAKKEIKERVELELQQYRGELSLAEKKLSTSNSEQLELINKRLLLSDREEQRLHAYVNELRPEYGLSAIWYFRCADTSLKLDDDESANGYINNFVEAINKIKDDADKKKFYENIWEFEEFDRTLNCERWTKRESLRKQVLDIISLEKKVTIKS